MENIKEETTKGIEIKQKAEELRTMCREYPFMTLFVVESPDMYKQSVLFDVLDYICDKVDAEDIDRKGIKKIVTEYAGKRTKIRSVFYKLLDHMYIEY
jgi:hypothetical protein